MRSKIRFVQITVTPSGFVIGVDDQGKLWGVSSTDLYRDSMSPGVVDTPWKALHRIGYTPDEE